MVAVDAKGYGNALRAGIEAARGKYVIIGDSDDSYDFLHLEGFVHKLEEGCDLVIGNRFLGGIRPGAMPVLSALGENLSLAAAEHRFDPVVGREAEIDELLDVLAKRHANSACLIGPAPRAPAVFPSDYDPARMD